MFTLQKDMYSMFHNLHIANIYHPVISNTKIKDIVSPREDGLNHANPQKRNNFQLS